MKRTRRMSPDGGERLVLGRRSCPRVLREMPARLGGTGRNIPAEAALPPVTPFPEGTLETVLSLLKREYAGNVGKG